MSLLLHIIVTYIKENIITKIKKLYSLPRNPRVGNTSPALFVKKPLCTGDLSSVCKIIIERPARGQWKGNQAIKSGLLVKYSLRNIFFKHHVDLFWLFLTLYMVQASGQHLSFIGTPWLEHTIKENFNISDCWSRNMLNFDF